MLFAPEPTYLPPDVLHRVERVMAFHRASAAAPVPAAHPPQPPAYAFADFPQIKLPAMRLNARSGTLDVLSGGLDALPENLRQAPHDLITLATWLELSYGITAQCLAEGVPQLLRAAPSAGALYPCELYVLALSIEGLDPGFYHYSPTDSSLYKIREAASVVRRLQRGRPDLSSLKSSPASILLSTVFSRSASQFGLRGYRLALLDAGHLLGNILASAAGLGISADLHSKPPETATREVLGLPPDAPFAHRESVQAIVLWSGASPNPSRGDETHDQALSPISRPADSLTASDPGIERIHHDCVAPGVAVQDIRPPLTDLSPLPDEIDRAVMPPNEPYPSYALGRVLRRRRSAHDFERGSIPSDLFSALNRAAFRTGTFAPFEPAGPHVAAVRPMWFVHAVDGMDSGVWYYEPATDAWSVIRRGNSRAHARKLSMGQDIAETGAALGFLIANLAALTRAAGPDAYRLAHLEAGLSAQRLQLACESLELGSCGIGRFLDEDLKRFLGLNKTGWEILYGIAIGPQIPLASDAFDEEPE